MATYKKIRDYIKDKHGFTTVTGWIADVKEQCGLPMKIAHNRINPLERVHFCPPKKIEVIKEAFRHFDMIE